MEERGHANRRLTVGRPRLACRMAGAYFATGTVRYLSVRVSGRLRRNSLLGPVVGFQRSLGNGGADKRWPALAGQGRGRDDNLIIALMC